MCGISPSRHPPRSPRSAATPSRIPLRPPMLPSSRMWRSTCLNSFKVSTSVAAAKTRESASCSISVAIAANV